jgi:hypothetical protein
MIFEFSNTSLMVCALCLLIAVVIGAFRHWSIYLWNRTEIVVIGTAGGNKTEEWRLGPYVPAWKLRRVRIRSWLLVTAFSTLGAVLATSFDIQCGSKHFLGILLARWLLSALLGGVGSYALRQAQRLQGDRPEVSDDVLEFCGFTRTHDSVNAEAGADQSNLLRFNEPANTGGERANCDP